MTRRSSSVLVRPLPTRTYWRASVMRSQSSSWCSLLSIGSLVGQPPLSWVLGMGLSYRGEYTLGSPQEKGWQAGITPVEG